MRNRAFFPHSLFEIKVGLAVFSVSQYSDADCNDAQRMIFTDKLSRPLSVKSPHLTSFSEHCFNQTLLTLRILQIRASQQALICKNHTLCVICISITLCHARNSYRPTPISCELYGKAAQLLI